MEPISRVYSVFIGVMKSRNGSSFGAALAGDAALEKTSGALAGAANFDQALVAVLVGFAVKQVHVGAHQVQE